MPKNIEIPIDSEYTIAMFILQLVLTGITIHPTHVYVILNPNEVMSLDTREIYAKSEIEKLVGEKTFVTREQDVIQNWIDKFNQINPDIKVYRYPV